MSLYIVTAPADFRTVAGHQGSLFVSISHAPLEPLPDPIPCKSSPLPVIASAAMIARSLVLFALSTLLILVASAQTAPVITSSPSPGQIVEQGDSLVLTVAATNATGYQWNMPSRRGHALTLDRRRTLRAEPKGSRIDS